MTKSVHFSMTLVMTMIFCLGSAAVAIAGPHDAEVDAELVAGTVDRIEGVLDDLYVMSEKVPGIMDKLRGTMQDGKYAGMPDPAGFALQLTEDLRRASGDLHLAVRFDPPLASMLENFQGKEPPAPPLVGPGSSIGNHGVKEVRILDGNIGYLDLRLFDDPAAGGEAVVAAMHLLADCMAVIIDLRNNPGGHGEMVRLISSYFLDDRPRHLDTVHDMTDDSYHQMWSQVFVPGRKMTDTDLYILTSRRTGSAAEAFPYIFKHLSRATIVGERTAGAAHPIKPVSLGRGFVMNVPYARPVNPNTGGNWEGTGVQPDIQIDPERALATAHLAALEKLAASESDPLTKAGYEWSLASVRSRSNPVELDVPTMQTYTGIYGKRSITLDGGELVYRFAGKPPMRMVPLDTDLFMFEEVPYFRVRIVVENDRVTAVQGLYDNGRVVTYPKEG